MNYQFAALIIKIGSLFANCDGKYDCREKRFIENFVCTLKTEMNFSEEQTSMLQSMSGRLFAYDDVMLDTQNMLLNFDGEDRRNIYNVIQNYIQEVIAADGTFSEEEKLLFEQWNKDLKI